MRLFTQAQVDLINKAAEKSKDIQTLSKPVNAKSINDDLNEMSKQVIEYFKESPAILIRSKEALHDYVSKCIEFGYAGIDTETTGLDRVNDHIVGASLYVPGSPECYIPMKHLIPIFDSPYKDQLSYEDVGEELSRLVSGKCKLIFANADFDLAMIYHDLKADLNDAFYYDVILAWRCLKEDERDNSLKGLYNKYVLKGKGHPMKFRDFFTPSLFPYSKPEVAKLYAANDARITYDLFRWQLPYVTKDHPKCKKAHLEAIADLIWNVEFPLVPICQNMHRTGVYIDKNVSDVLRERYRVRRADAAKELSSMVDDIVSRSSYVPSFGVKRPFVSGKDFNPNSPLHVKYLLYNLLNIPVGDKGQSTDKSVLHDINLPVTNKILEVRSFDVLINTFVEKLPKVTTSDSRIHAQFKQIGADTGRMSSAEPNLQNIPSHATDIRHMFRATPGYVMLSSDYSAQEPRITAYISQDPELIKSFREDRDVYATIASLAFKLPYEKCLEFHPETHEYQPDGKARRSEAKFILLGITYGRSVPSIAEQLYGTRKDMTDEEKTSEAQKVYDAVLNAFPNLRQVMLNSQAFAKKHGYTETILGRRRHLPDMQLPEFEFEPMPGYVNPDVDPLDPTTLQNTSGIPDRIVESLRKEFAGYKYFGQIARRIRELRDDKIKVINNRPKINDAKRQTLNGIIQGSAADQTKLAILMLEQSEEWKNLGGRLLLPVHDELIAEVPIENWEEGGRVLSSTMIKAASFLPFPSKCDVTTTLRWYGLEFPCKYTKPSSLSEMSEDEIKWVQYMLHECEYDLPVFKDENGEKPRGDAALGVNGKKSDQLDLAIRDYMNRYKIQDDKTFIDNIEKRVVEGC